MIWNIKVWQTCKKIKNQEGGQHFFTPLYTMVCLNTRFWLADRYALKPGGGGSWPPRCALKSFNAQLAVHYPLRN